MTGMFAFTCGAMPRRDGDDAAVRDQAERLTLAKRSTRQHRMSFAMFAVRHTRQANVDGRHGLAVHGSFWYDISNHEAAHKL